MWVVPVVWNAGDSSKELAYCLLTTDHKINGDDAKAARKNKKEDCVKYGEG
jgi:hypothetical protein